MKKLREVTTFLSCIEAINAGGCGIAALAIYKWMEKNAIEMLKDIEIVFLYNDSWEYNTNCSRIQDGENCLIVPAHIILRTSKGKEIDAHCTWNGRETEHTVGIQHLINTINTPVSNGWNNWFDRKENIKKIAKKLDISLDEVNVNYKHEY